MNYIFLMEWADHEFWRVFSGKSIDDPKMLEAVKDWVSGQADGMVSDSIVNDGLDADFNLYYGILDGEIIDAIQIRSDIITKINQEDAENDAVMRKRKEDEERATLKRFKEKYEK